MTGTIKIIYRIPLLSFKAINCFEYHLAPS